MTANVVAIRNMLECATRPELHGWLGGEDLSRGWLCTVLLDDRGNLCPLYNNMKDYK